MLNIQESSKKMGQLLVARGWATGEQVLRAVMSQRNLGGRLGTRLLELGIVSESHLLEILAEQQAAPAVPLTQLRSISRDILGLISADMAQRYWAVPFAANNREIHVATPSVKNVALIDELSFRTGRRVRAFVTHEVRIYEALEKYYGIPCPLRYRQLAQRLTSSPRPAMPPSIDDTGNLPIQALAKGPRIQWNSLEEKFNPGAKPDFGAEPDLVAEPASVAGRPPETETGTESPTPAPARQLALSDVDRLLGYADSVSAMGEVILKFLAQHSQRGAIFRLRQETLLPWLGHGEGFDRAIFRQFEIRFSEPSVFLNLQRGAEFHFGPLPPMPTHRELVHCWGGKWPSQCLLLPIRLRDRMVMVLYAEPDSGHPAPIQLEDWKTLAAMVTDALELSILRKKLPTH